MTDHGLSTRHIGGIAKILRENCPAIQKASLFGSRATGRYKSYSDIDLVLYGDINAATADRLWTLFDESSLPYKVDVQVFDLVGYPPLIRHIEEQAQTLLTKEQIYSEQ